MALIRFLLLVHQEAVKLRSKHPTLQEAVGVPEGTSEGPREPQMVPESALGFSRCGEGSVPQHRYRPGSQAPRSTRTARRDTDGGAEVSVTGTER